MNGWLRRALGVAVLVAALVAMTGAGTEQIGRFYPERAQRRGVEGRVVLSCQVEIDHTLSNCQVVSEDPPGWGFGEAAIKMSKLFRAKPTTKDGQPTAGGRLTIPLTFKMPTSPANPPPPSSPSAPPANATAAQG
jgi:TonB family protein